jgi:hypothetical protein
VIITRENYTHLEDIALYIRDAVPPEFRRRTHIDIRYVFIGARISTKKGAFLTEQEYQSVMPDLFQEALPYIESFIENLYNFGLSLSLKNLPICNFSPKIQSIPFSRYQ